MAHMTHTEWVSRWDAAHDELVATERRIDELRAESDQWPGPVLTRELRALDSRRLDKLDTLSVLRQLDDAGVVR